MACPNSYVFWNNKGGVGKTTLSFQMACAEAERIMELEGDDRLVYFVDMCPQANATMLFLGSEANHEVALQTRTEARHGELETNTPARTVVGILERAFPSHGQPKDNFEICPLIPCNVNSSIPSNIRLIPSHEMLDTIVEDVVGRRGRIHGNSELVLRKKFCDVLSRHLDTVGDVILIVDTNPALSLYTQMALLCAKRLVVPVKLDSFSIRAIRTLFFQLYAVQVAGAADLIVGGMDNLFLSGIVGAQRVPKVHTVVETMVPRREASASTAMKEAFHTFVQDLRTDNPHLFTNGSGGARVHDWLTNNIIAQHTGSPIKKIPASVVINGVEVKRVPTSLQGAKEDVDDTCKTLFD